MSWRYPAAAQGRYLGGSCPWLLDGGGVAADAQRMAVNVDVLDVDGGGEGFSALS